MKYTREQRIVIIKTIRKQKYHGIVAIILATLLLVLPGDILGSGGNDGLVAIITYALGIWLVMSRKPIYLTGIPEVDDYDEDADEVRG